MLHMSTYVDVDNADDETRNNILDKCTPQQGVLLTEGTGAAKIILEAFPAGGYSMSDAYELRDLILKFNKAHNITPTML